VPLPEALDMLVQDVDIALTPTGKESATAAEAAIDLSP